MPIIPNLMERTYMLRLNRGPGPMLDLFSGISLEAAMLAVDLDVFEELTERPATPAELATRLDMETRGLEALLRFLSRAGYVSEQNGRYSVTTMTEKWLMERSEESYARYFRFWQEVLGPFWREHAHTAIRDGRPPQTVYEWLDDHPELWPIAQDAFELTAELIGEEVAESVAVPESGTVLDVGGGHALYSIAICERYPTASATIIDAPEMEGIAQSNVSTADVQDHISFKPGDYEADPFEATYDTALLFNIIHGNDEATNRTLLKDLAAAVRPGGQLAILDQFSDEARASIANTGTRFLDMTYLVSLGGRTYHTDTVSEWLSEAGFSLEDSVEFSDRNMTLLLADRTESS